ncbi:MAG: hypothetical protein KDD41_03165 [Flavobacteriales bacterium]|nr:hypothetical protein [Flavobacteriales bacterium]
MIVLFVLFSCSKDEGGKTVANGLVQDDTTLDPIEKADVYLTRQEKDCQTCPVTTQQTTKSGPEGGFNFNFDADANFTYRVSATKTGYFDNLASPQVDLKNGQGNTPVIKLQPEANLTLQIKNTSPFDANDKIVIAGGGTYKGMTVDTNEVLIVLGNENNLIKWTVTKNGSSNTYSHFLNCPSFSNTAYTINY